MSTLEGHTKTGENVNGHEITYCLYRVRVTQVLNLYWCTAVFLSFLCVVQCWNLREVPRVARNERAEVCRCQRNSDEHHCFSNATYLKWDVIPALFSKIRGEVLVVQLSFFKYGAFKGQLLALLCLCVGGRWRESRWKEDVPLNLADDVHVTSSSWGLSRDIMTSCDLI